MSRWLRASASSSATRWPLIQPIQDVAHPPITGLSPLAAAFADFTGYGERKDLIVQG
jgi:hypothetical protein